MFRVFSGLGPVGKKPVPDPKNKRSIFPLVFGWLGVVVATLGLLLWLLPGQRRDSTIPVTVTEVVPSGQALWFAASGVLARRSPDQSSSEVVRLRYLRTQRLRVQVVEAVGDRVLFRSDKVRAGDLLVLDPGALPSDRAAVPLGGVDDERLVRLTIEAGIAAIMGENLEESVRFLSADYRDSLKLTKAVMVKVLERTYKEFASLHVEFAESPHLEISADEALVHARLRVRATYRGRANFLLGDDDAPNAVLVLLSRSRDGWKVSRIEGLRPLGFGNGFLRLLAAQAGLSLTGMEEEERQRACMPCRQRMAERFGPHS
jgi:hypothetical protein